MDSLIELVKIVSKHKIKNIEIIGEEASFGTKYQKLYDAICAGEVSNDDEAVRLLYPEGLKHNSYLKLKSRLKGKLINTLFFIDSNRPSFTDTQSAYYETNKNALAVRNLLERGARRSGIELAERTFKIAKKFELTEISILILKELRMHYGAVDLKLKKYEYYDSLLKRQLEIFNAEMKAEYYFTKILSEYSTSKESRKHKVVSLAKQFSKDLIDNYSGINSFKFIRISYLLHSITFEISMNYEKSIETCMAAIKIFKSKPYESKNAIFNFQLRILINCIQLQNFKRGREVAELCVEQIPDGTFNWFVVLYYYFLLATHSKNYKKAYYILRLVITNTNFKNFYSAHKEMWYVNEAFCHFLIETGRVERNGINASKSERFRINRFLNNIPHYSKDKRGLNITIIILQILYLLKDKKYNKIIDRIDSLNQYCHRYLKRDSTFRSNCFIKMLIKMATRGNFNRKATVRHTKLIFEKMSNVPINVADQEIEIEIVPYEDLWGFVLDLL